MPVRALLAFIALPGVVAYVVPVAIAASAGERQPFRTMAIVPLAAGTALLVWCVRRFLVEGRGTLAPWEPPRHLVVTGPYRWSRNPMYVAVTLVVLGWAIGFRSWIVLIYAALLAAAFHLRVAVVEEPWLARRFREPWARYAARVPRWLFPSRRAVLGFWAVLAVALPIGGLIYEAFADARDAREFPPPGRLVDVGGRRLHLLCIGDGGPIVLFEASGFGTSLSSPRARERIAARTTVCSYDRRGKGWSDPAAGVTTAAALANDLGVLQDRARLQPPFVIVTASIGGLTTEMFARTYPERVAGLVFADAATSLLLPMASDWSGALTALACAGSGLSRFGLVRLLDPLAIGSASDEARRAAGLNYNARAAGQSCAMSRGLDATIEEFATAPEFPRRIPLVVLSASSTAQALPAFLDGWVDPAPMRARMLETHRQFATKSDRGKWLIVPESTHLIGSSQPDAVADAVFDILELSR
jgi:protein-S-isoprenylcysteine O-methyltransferase Ste14/pimeloyl-ACP methyl ester carboxylesterase